VQSFKYLMKIRRVGTALAATVLFAVAPDARAKPPLKCENPLLFRADEKRLIAAARRVLPPDLKPLVSGQCRWTDSAFALITTEKFTEDTGVTHWWVSSCDRDERDWTCRPAEFQQEIATQFVVGGIPRNARLSFDGETSLEVAKALASRALTIYANAAPQLPYCKGIKGQESRWRIFRESHPLPIGNQQIHLTVGLDGETETVWFGDLVLPDDAQIGIDFPFADDQSASCWSARES
jgi:hypothetical protein